MVLYAPEPVKASCFFNNTQHRGLFTAEIILYDSRVLEKTETTFSECIVYSFLLLIFCSNVSCTRLHHQ